MEKLKIFLQTLTEMSDKDFEVSKIYLSVIQLKKGDFFLQQGSISKSIAFINNGSFRTYYYNQDGDEITACFRTENTLVSSYTSFISQEPSFLSIVALEDSELIVIDYDNLQILYKRSPIWQKIGRLIAEREYINMEQYASVLNNVSAKEKYLRLINEHSEVIQKSNLNHIASYLGISRRQLSRIRQDIRS